MPVEDPSLLRNLLEYTVIILIGVLLYSIQLGQWLNPAAMAVLIVLAALGKTVFFVRENLQQLWLASTYDLPYHRFIGLMAVNMTQIALSFGLDFACLYSSNMTSFGGINPQFNAMELLFEFFYYSVLNFSFFGYGDITPQTIPAKLITMMEIILAFLTVIFLLSDFISLKESLRTHANK
jgi:hypothetical protein